MLAIAALALTATGAQAFSGDALARAGLTDSQVAAFEEARELRREGDIKAARNVLVHAGIDDVVIERVRSAMAEKKHVSTSHHPHRHFAPHKTATDLTASEQAAYEVAKAANDRDAMHAILEEAGIAGGGRTHSAKFLRDGRELE